MALELQGVVLNLLWVPGSQSLEGEGVLVTADRGSTSQAVPIPTTTGFTTPFNTEHEDI